MLSVFFSAKKSAICVLALLIFLNSGSLQSRPAHPYFVSMTELTYNPKEKTMEITVRIFTNDLEKELAGFCHCRADLIQEQNHKKMEEILKSYLSKHLKISINRKERVPLWLGYQNEEESTWCFMEIPTEAPEIIRIENRILFGTQEKQLNFVRFKKPGFDKTIQLANPESSAVF